MYRSSTRTASAAPLAIVIFLGFAIFPVVPGRAQGPENSIQGHVRTTTGGPLPSVVRVRLEVANNITVDQALVGSTGTFGFYNLKDEYYTVVVTAEGYQPATWQVDMHYLASRFPMVYLIPAGKKKKSPPPDMSTTDLAAPKKAVKEYVKGHKAFEAKDLRTARAHYEKAVAMDPCYARALTELGVVQTMQHDFHAAETSLKKSIKCDGGFLEGYLQMQILLDMEKKYAEGESTLQKGLRVAPNDWRLHYGLGIERQHLGKYQQAIDEYLKAQSLSSSVPPDVHIRLADAYLELKDYNQAYTEMQTYLKVDPNGPFANQTRSMLQRLASMPQVKGHP